MKGQKLFVRETTPLDTEEITRFYEAEGRQHQAGDLEVVGRLIGTLVAHAAVRLGDAGAVDGGASWLSNRSSTHSHAGIGPSPLTPLPPGEGNEAAELVSIVVTERLRRKRVATALMRDLERLLVSRGVTRILVRPLPESLAFFSSTGFRQEGEFLTRDLFFLK